MAVILLSALKKFAATLPLPLDEIENCGDSISLAPYTVLPVRRTTAGSESNLFSKTQVCLSGASNLPNSMYD
jgi:hypothetical protein